MAARGDCATPVGAQALHSDPAATGFVFPSLQGLDRCAHVPRRDGWSVPCSAAFADAVRSLALRRAVNPAKLVHQVLDLTNWHVLQNTPDPGPGNPEGYNGHARVTLWLDGPEELDAATVRRAMALALTLAGGGGLSPEQQERRRLQIQVDKLHYRNRALMSAIERLAFPPGDHPPQTVTEAAAMIGLVAERSFDEQRVTKRFRELAPVFHPDTGILPCKRRMALLIEARNLLIRHLRRRR